MEKQIDNNEETNNKANGQNEVAPAEVKEKVETKESKEAASAQDLNAREAKGESQDGLKVGQTQDQPKSREKSPQQRIETQVEEMKSNDLPRAHDPPDGRAVTDDDNVLLESPRKSEPVDADREQRNLPEVGGRQYENLEATRPVKEIRKRELPVLEDAAKEYAAGEDVETPPSRASAAFFREPNNGEEYQDAAFESSRIQQEARTTPGASAHSKPANEVTAPFTDKNRPMVTEL